MNIQKLSLSRLTDLEKRLMVARGGVGGGRKGLGGRD